MLSFPPTPIYDPAATATANAPHENHLEKFSRAFILLSTVILSGLFGFNSVIIVDYNINHHY
jgi:hypothetical protein